MCKSWCELIIGVIILIFVFVETQYSRWVIIIAAILLIIHSLACKKCFGGSSMAMSSGSNSKSKKRK
ncbi:MAG: hypothetical protein Q8P57_00545 [Candidatus Pacearchaeota archaeon]|nr:hypothetical protein [Candidatus Pacearchaeota archaeon]